MTPLDFTVPLADGRELRLLSDGERCELQSWSRYPGGHAMMGGGFRMDAQDLRVLLHAVKYMIWDCERAALRVAVGLAPVQAQGAAGANPVPMDLAS